MNWLEIGNMLGIDFNRINFGQWVIGCEHEKGEHLETVRGDLTMIAKIARDHFREDPDYYKKLKQIEGK